MAIQKRPLADHRPARAGRAIFLLPILAVLLLSRTVLADSVWQASTSSWLTPGNWAGGLPDSGSTADINNAGTAQIASGNAAATTLNLGQAAGQSGNVSITGGTLTAGVQEVVGVAGNGSITQSGGLNTMGTSDYLVLGANANSNGTYTLSGIGSLSAFEYIGEFGTGTMNQSGGTNNASTVYLASGNLAATGYYNLSGGSLNVGILLIGYSGTGSFSQTGGQFADTSNLNIVNNKSGLSIANASDTSGVVNNSGVLSLAGSGPGATAGKLSITGNYSQSDELDIGIGGPNAGTDFGFLTASGTASLLGTLKVNLTNGFTPSFDETFTILTAGTRSGTFSTTNLTYPGGHFNIAYTSNSVILTAIPEPGSLALIAMAMPIAIRRRNRRSVPSRP